MQFRVKSISPSYICIRKMMCWMYMIYFFSVLTDCGIIFFFVTMHRRFENFGEIIVWDPISMYSPCTW